MHLDRNATLARLRAARPFETDVLIIGGGVNGAGLLRDLALNGVPCLLVERGDFASGATAASSRMIHGGLRYLENGEFRLVRESLHERNRLLANAPHAVTPLPTTIPLLSRWSGFGNALGKFFGASARPGRRGAVLVKIGLMLYDAFSGRDRGALARHRFDSRERALARRPSLDPRLVATATYHDACVAQPERLVLDVLSDAVAEGPHVLAANYLAAEAVGEGGDVTLRDTVSGEVFAVRPRAVVNATGAWIDLVGADLGAPSSFIGGTKGSHLVIEHPELRVACDGEQLFFENTDGRVCILFEVNGRVLAGSTDLRTDDPAPVCTDEEADYILESVRTVFPRLRTPVGLEHVIARFCGVRPLPRDEAGFTGRISRDHSLRTLPPTAGRPWPLYAMIGGKWTTFRAFAEQTADRLFAELGRERRASTTDLRIGKTTTDGAAGPDPRAEAVVRLDDWLLRRTTLGLYAGLDEERFAREAAALAAALGWDAARLESEKARAREILAVRHAVRLVAPQGAVGAP
ncbi:MAG: glycerol-3-phosphate dehydrogenase/oxidase [Burkholderiales bacterium]|nr:glycerol-3-phosphate dehydrogenase/oxidase [Opitutaceae bacterium]